MREVSISWDNMQTPVPLRIGVRLVTGINNRPPDSGLKPHGAFKKVGAGTNLKTRFLTIDANTHTPGARENYAGCKKWQKPLRHLIKRHRTIHQVILVGTVRLALRISVIFIQLHGGQTVLGVAGDLSKSLIRDSITCRVVEHRLGGCERLRGRILGVRMIHIKTCPIGQDRVHRNPVPVQPLRVAATAVNHLLIPINTGLTQRL